VPHSAGFPPSAGLALGPSDAPGALPAAATDEEAGSPDVAEQRPRGFGQAGAAVGKQGGSTQSGEEGAVGAAVGAAAPPFDPYTLSCGCHELLASLLYDSVRLMARPVGPEPPPAGQPPPERAAAPLARGEQGDAARGRARARIHPQEELVEGGGEAMMWESGAEYGAAPRARMAAAAAAAPQPAMSSVTVAMPPRAAVGEGAAEDMAGDIGAASLGHEQAALRPGGGLSMGRPPPAAAAAAGGAASAARAPAARALPFPPLRPPLLPVAASAGGGSAAAAAAAAVAGGAAPARSRLPLPLAAKPAATAATAPAPSVAAPGADRQGQEPAVGAGGGAGQGSVRGGLGGQAGRAGAVGLRQRQRGAAGEGAGRGRAGKPG
jgi:hypothetical protein